MVSISTAERRSPTADFGVEISFRPDSPDPARVFRCMLSLIGAFEFLDRQLVRSIDVKIEPVLCSKTLRQDRYELGCAAHFKRQTTAP